MIKTFAFCLNYDFFDVGDYHDLPIIISITFITKIIVQTIIFILKSSLSGECNSPLQMILFLFQRLYFFFQFFYCCLLVLNSFY
jgi:hypothetical protein